MSLNNDYIMQTLTNQRVNELHARAANDRLARIAAEGRVPWWRRLLHDSASSVASSSEQANGAQANGVRQPRLRRNHPTAPARHVARY